MKIGFVFLYLSNLLPYCSFVPFLFFLASTSFPRIQITTVNQALEILNLPSVPDGDKRLQTLNVVDAAKANKYQLGENQEREDENVL